MLFQFTDEVPGAYPNGARVRKVNSEPGDAHKDGDLGTVRGSIEDIDQVAVRMLKPPYSDSKYAYFIQWDDSPGYQVGTIGAKVELVDD